MTDGRILPSWVLSKRSRRIINDGSSNESTSLMTIGLFAATVVAAYAGYELKRCISKNGWEGTLRLVWEGDPYPEYLRDAVDTIEDAEFDLRATYRIDDRLRGLEESLDTATSHVSSSASSSSDATIDKLWNDTWIGNPANSSASNYGSNPLNIQQTLADISDRLDKIAERVDSVVLSSVSDGTNNNFLEQCVRERKKKLSKAIVSNMERCDALLASLQVFRDRKDRRDHQP